MLKPGTKKSTTLSVLVWQKHEPQPALWLQKSRECSEGRHSQSGACVDAELQRGHSTAPRGSSLGCVNIEVGPALAAPAVHEQLGHGKALPCPQSSKDSQTHFISFLALQEQGLTGAVWLLRDAGACHGLQLPAKRAHLPLYSLMVLHKSCEWLNLLPGLGKQRVSAQ